MKKFKLLCITLVICLVSLTGCGSATTESTEGEAVEEESTNSYKITTGYTSVYTILYFDCESVSEVDGKVVYTVSDSNPSNISEVVVTNGTVIVKYNDSSIETYCGNVKVRKY